MKNMNLSDKSKEALKSEIWQKSRETVRREIIKEYLKNGYANEDKQHDVSVSGVTYKVLERGEVTTFYDNLGNTLFSVENEKLAIEYEKMMGGGSTGSKDEVPNAAEKAGEDFKEKACEKLCGELKKAKDKQFADPVIGYLLKRCGEDNGLAQDVMQDHKTWEKCLQYIFAQARKQAKGNHAVVRDDTVYEWAEDYYHKDDKAEEKKKAQKAVERKKADKKNPKQDAKKENKTEEKIAEPPKPKKNPKEIDGQMDLFSMMGM